jgi:hypothetical protein
VILICQAVYPTHPKTSRAVLIAGSLAYGLLVAGETIQLINHVYQSY